MDAIQGINVDRAVEEVGTWIAARAVNQGDHPVEVDTVGGGNSRQIATHWRRAAHHPVPRCVMTEAKAALEHRF